MNYYYFVVYKLRENGCNDFEITCNVILKNIHPLLWASQTPDVTKNLIVHILFWEEIPEEIALNLKVKKYFPSPF